MNSRNCFDCASAGLLGLINWPMIAPFLVTRADSKNRVDNWFREISPWAVKMAGLITRFLTSRAGSGLSAFQGGRNFFRVWCPCPGALQDSLLQAHIHKLCDGQMLALSHLSVGSIPVTPESKYEENSSCQLKMGRETIHCGVWYVNSGSYHLCLHLFTFLYCKH